MRPRSFTDRELLDTARACFLEHGPGVSTAHIAEELGVSQASLFKRFKTKKELLVAAMIPTGAPDWVSDVARGPDARPVRVQLDEMARQIDAFFTTMVPCIAILRAAGFVPEDMKKWGDNPPPVIAHRTISSWLRTLTEAERIYVADPDSTALVLMAGLQTPHMLRHMLGSNAPPTNDNYLDNFVDLIWAGIAPRDPERARSESGSGSRMNDDQA